MLIFNVRNQEIERIDNFAPAEKSINYLVAEFNFKTPDWNGAQKTAVFKNKKIKNAFEVLLDNGHCVVPWEAINEGGVIEVSVYGIKDEKIITTNIAECKVNKTLYGGSTSNPPTPNVYEQLLEKMGNVDGGTFEEWKE